MFLNLDRRLMTCIVIIFSVNTVFVRSIQTWGIPTIVDNANFNSTVDALAIYKSSHNLCCVSKLEIADVLTRRSLPQRLEISKKYEQIDETSTLVKMLEQSVPFGPVDSLLVYLVRTPDELFVNDIGAAIFGWGTNEKALNEALCCRRSVNLTRDRELFAQYFGCDILKDVMDDVSGIYGELVKALLTVERATEIDYEKVKAVARKLTFVTPNVPLELDKSLLLKLFSERSYEEIQLVSVEYAELAEVQLMDTLYWELDGDFRNLIIEILAYAEDPIKYYATKIHDELNNWVLFQDLYTVNRYILKTADYNLATIKHVFPTMYHRSLEQFVVDRTSGDYHYVLFSMVKGNLS